MSEFDDEGMNDKEFEEILKRFENMINNGESSFFDADELEEVIEYYMQWLNYEMAKRLSIMELRTILFPQF
ncbi:MAG: hypothetical protein IPG08_10050 [Sphingobacteriaceae bacterium]|nr:hypothetical protein [Sphingobacteriaceae bacterium]